MRVLLVTDALPGVPRGGCDLHLQELHSALRARGVDAELLPMAEDAPDAMREAAASGGPPGSRFAASVSNDAMFERLRALLRERQPDAVHFHNIQGLSHRMPGLARREGAAVVWTLHDFWPLCQRVHLHKGDGRPCDGPQGGAACGPCLAGGSPRGLFAAPVFALRTAGFVEAMRQCHALLVPSAFARDRYAANGADPKRLHVLPPAVPRPPRLAELPQRADVCRFVMAGDLRAAKGADLAVEAMRLLRGTAAALELHGGPPAPPAPAEPEFEARLRERAEGSPTRFFGRYAPERLLPILDGATALLVPSRVRESFGRTANLALLAGIPVVAADHGAVPEFVREGVNGALFVPGDAASLAAAMRRVMDHGLEMQARAESWPQPPELAAHVQSLLPLYEWKP
jgi:glycosyltransferase involved in cell wall biosynthesis